MFSLGFGSVHSFYIDPFVGVSLFIFRMMEEEEEAAGSIDDL